MHVLEKVSNWLRNSDIGESAWRISRFVWTASTAEKLTILIGHVQRLCLSEIFMFKKITQYFMDTWAAGNNFWLKFSPDNYSLKI